MPLIRSALNRKIRYAIVGLPAHVDALVLPALKRCPHSEPVALVSPNRPLLKSLSKRWKIPLIYEYAAYDDCLTSANVDAVYLALPQALHLESMTQAIRSGIHVFSEGALASVLAESRTLLEESHANHVLLHEIPPFTTTSQILLNPTLQSKKVKRFFQDAKKASGDARWISIHLSGPLAELRSKEGFDLRALIAEGLQASRSLLEAEPIEVYAQVQLSGTSFLDETDETLCVMLRFERGLSATLTCSRGASFRQAFEWLGTRGTVRGEWQPGNSFKQMNPYLPARMNRLSSSSRSAVWKFQTRFSKDGVSHWRHRDLEQRISPLQLLRDALASFSLRILASEQSTRKEQGVRAEENNAILRRMTDLSYADQILEAARLHRGITLHAIPELHSIRQTRTPRSSAA
jgi:predicted dehydrogenase